MDGFDNQYIHANHSNRINFSIFGTGKAIAILTCFYLNLYILTNTDTLKNLNPKKHTL